MGVLRAVSREDEDVRELSRVGERGQSRAANTCPNTGLPSINVTTTPEVLPPSSIPHRGRPCGQRRSR